MSRYVDADALIDFFGNIQVELGAYRISFKAVNRAIDAMATIDIVRCKECKWAEPNREGDYDCKCHIPTFRIKANDFCSYGERREP